MTGFRRNDAALGKSSNGRAARPWHDGDDTIEATSGRVWANLWHRDDAWERCYAALIEQARVRLEQEGRRRGADCVHVKDELIEPRRDEASGETWLYGRFRYGLYREPAVDQARAS